MKTETDTMKMKELNPTALKFRGAEPETNKDPESHVPGRGIRAFQTWLREIGKDDVTGWRWRTRGWLKTVNIAGRLYITDEAIADFIRRAESGEFAKEHKTPSAGFTKQ